MIDTPCTLPEQAGPGVTTKNERNLKSIYEQELEAARRYAPAYDAAYETPFWQSERRSFAELVAAYAGRRGIELPSARVLDVGTGTGSILLRLSYLGACRMVGIDLSPEMLALAREKVPDAELRLGAIEDAVRESASFDIVTGFSVLHHLPDLASFFGELSRVLRPGGVFAFSDPNADSILSGRYSKWIVWTAIFPLHKLLRYRNRGELARRPTMADANLYSDAHRPLSRNEILATLPATLVADVRSHGVLAPTFNSALVERRLDLSVLRAARALDRRLPLQGSTIVTTGHRFEAASLDGAS